MRIVAYLGPHRFTTQAGSGAVNEASQFIGRGGSAARIVSVGLLIGNNWRERRCHTL